MSDDYPFDREHVLVSVNFPVAQLPNKDALFARVRELAERRGGTESGSAEPIAAYIGKPGFETFGMDVAFEAGDVNIDGFIRWIQDDLKGTGVSTEYNPADVFGPDEPEKPSFRR